jgi:hypothetical protein
MPHQQGGGEAVPLIFIGVSLLGQGGKYFLGFGEQMLVSLTAKSGCLEERTGLEEYPAGQYRMI